MNGRSLILLAATGAAFAAGGAAVGATTEPAAVPPIVYAAGGTGTERLGAELYVREADGTTRRLTRNRVFDGFPRWSPDRSKIVFVRARGSDSDLYIMNADGTGVRRLAGSARRFQDLYPAWSPDGRTIAFASNRFGENEILVIGSQAVHGTLRGDLPPEAERSVEADVAALNDPDERKADLIDGSIGEASMFHETFGYYAQGVSQSAAVLPDGWQDRLVRYESPATNGVVAWCLEIHDLWLSKAVAMRQKDIEFCRALARSVAWSAHRSPGSLASR